MKPGRSVVAACLAAALVAPVPAWAAPTGDEPFAFATLENGTSVGFALVRSGRGQPTTSMGGAAFTPRSNAVNRVLVDREGGTYFGYRLEVGRQGASRQYRVSIRPLGSGLEKELLEKLPCPGCPPLALLAAFTPQFPGPLQVADGDALTLDLLTNPTTGEKILDIVKLSSSPLTPESMRQAAELVTDAQGAVARGASLFARGQYADAAAEYVRALALLPLDPVLHNKLGVCRQQARQEAGAREAYEKAIALNPSYAEAWNNLGTLEQGRRRFNKAIQSYRKAVLLKPSLATACKNMGAAFFAMGKIEEGFEAFQEAFRLDPTVLEAQSGTGAPSGLDAATQNYYVAKLLAANAQPEAALEFLRKARAAGFRDFGKVSADPDFKALRKDPRFLELIRDSGHGP